METLELVVGIIILVMSVLITILVLLQTGKEKKLGTITGGADTFFSKQRTGTKDRLLARITPPIAIIFTLLVVFAYLVVA
ncbi:MAG: preprotein translocase subunit SecG [Clostridiales bacterium]|jgi:preprotein translocase subunit SecG|nr:preprotein translocase subunit SecG [Clostridiales bacterium]HOA85413.1 preprotein translocase subunit SecG [Bacillota bacterium]